MDARYSRILSRMDCWAASLASMEVILVLTGSALILRIRVDKLEEEVGGSLEFVDELDSLLSGNKRGTMEEHAEDEEDPDLGGRV